MRIVEHRHKLYLKAGQHCVHDISCGILRRATLEEFVRQDVLHTLRIRYGWPRNMMITEYNLAPYGRGRIDLLLVLPGHKGDQPFAVIECKAPEIPIDHKCLDQASVYANQLSAPYVVLTNRSETVVMYNDGQSWWDVRDLPHFKKACQNPNIMPRPLTPSPPFQRPRWAVLSNPAALRNLVDDHYDVISPHTDAIRWRPILDFHGILRDEFESPSLPWDDHGYRIAEDWGVSERWFGNAGGGTWSGSYRSLLAYDQAQEPHTIGLMVSASSEHVNDPRFGNSPSKTYLVVAVSDAERRHISLELNLDEHTRRVRSGWELWHNGRLVAGRSGTVKRERVLRFVAQEASDLVVDNIVKLGTLPADRQLTWEDLQEPLLRLARYALIRDRLRSELKS